MENRIIPTFIVNLWKREDGLQSISIKFEGSKRQAKKDMVK
ncbi:hypothetical protein ABIB40_000595 [Pedobacter sp. UYP30]